MLSQVPAGMALGPEGALERERGVWRRALSSLPFAFLTISLLALAARLVYLAEVHRSPDFNSLVLDAQWYHLEARRLAAEGWMPRGALFRAPGYPYFLASLYSLWGDGLTAARIVQVILSSVSAGLVLWLGWRVYGKWVGWLAGLLAAFYGLLIYFSAEILGTTLVVATALLTLVLLVRADTGRGRGPWFVAGLALGISAIVRPTILLFGFLALLWAKGWGPWRANWGRVAALALGVAVCVTPVTIANYIASGEFVLIAHQGGVNYYVGNNPQTDGKTAAGPGVNAALLRSVGKTQDTIYLGAKVVAEETTGRELKPTDVSRYWLREALRFISRCPGDWVRLQLRKLYYFWNSYEIDNNRDIGAYIQANSPSLRLPHPGFWLVGPLGLLGLAISFRRGRPSLLLALFVIGQMLAVVAFFVCARFRVPAVPGLIILAALAVVTVVEVLRRRAWRQFVPLVLVTALIAWAVNTRALDISKDRDVLVHLFNQATAYMGQGLYDKAIDTYLKALEVGPGDAKTHLALGSAYLAKGLYDRALPAYKQATRLNPALVPAVHNDLGIYYIRMGQLDRAEEELNTALRANADYGLARLNLARIYTETGRRHLALEEYRHVLEISDVHPEQKSVAQAEIAVSAAEAGQLGEAVDLLRQALRLHRRNEAARLYLGDVLSRLGDREGAIEEWRIVVVEGRNEQLRDEARTRLEAMGERGRR